MKKFTYYAPTEVVFGENTHLQVGHYCKKYGATRVMVIYGKESAKKSGLIDQVEDSLKEAGLAFITKGGVAANPLLTTTREMIKEALSFQADFLLAVGGGSVIDTTKAVAHAIANPDTDVWEFWTGKELTKSTPIGSVLTISAAGSEMSNSAVLTNDELEIYSKRGLATPLNRGKFAIMNPRLTMSLPPYQIGAGVADILMHTLERFFAIVQGNYVTDEFAAGLCRTVMKFGPIAVKNPQDYDAMSEIMWCGSLSHNGITGLGSQGDTNRDGDWAVHQLGQALSAQYNSTHGATLTAVWGSWARYVVDADFNRFAQYARMVFHVDEENVQKAAYTGIEKTEEFFRSLGMPVSLSELYEKKLTQKEIEDVATICSYIHTRTIGSVKELNEEDMIAIYTNANEER